MIQNINISDERDNFGRISRIRAISIFSGRSGRSGKNFVFDSDGLTGVCLKSVQFAILLIKICEKTNDLCSVMK